MRWILLLLLSAAFAGCLSGDDGPDEAPVDTSEAPAPTHALVGTVEPDGLEAPTFTLPGPVATAGQVYAMGEPSVWAGLNGTVYATFPGCDDAVTGILSDGCPHAPVASTTDDGATWTRLNDDDGRLGPDGPAANGDADLAVDSAGTIYASNLGGGGIQIHKSTDHGAHWEYVANIVPPVEDQDDPDTREGADRQWIAAAGPGHVINAWMRTSPSRDVEINTTFDGGQTWTGRATFGDGIGWLGTVQFAPDGRHAYVPYTQPTGSTVDAIAGAVLQSFEMHVVRTSDGGRNWEDVVTGLSWTTAGANVHWSGGYMAPALDVTGDGSVVVAMAVDGDAGTGAPTPTNLGTKVIFAVSHDDGATWDDTGSFTEAVPGGAAQGANIVMPWVTGGAGDRFAVTYYHAPGLLLADAAGTSWNLEARVFDRGDGQWTSVHSVVDDMVHEGPLCSRGGSCAFPVDRTLLDFHEADVTPDGRLVVIYAADPVVDNQRAVQIRFAVQDGGTPLLAR